MSLDKTLDEAVALGDEAKKLAAVDIEAIFQRDVVAPMKSLVAAAPGWIKEIRQYTPVAEKVIAKVLKTPFVRDLPLGRMCDELGRLRENVGSLETGLKTYGELTSRCLLNRQGQYDRNAARNILGGLRGLFIVGPGTRKAMEGLVAQIEARLIILMDQRGASVGESGVSIEATPEKKTDGPGVVVEDPNWRP